MIRTNVVSVTELEQLCKQSSTRHEQYWVWKVTRSRVWVGRKTRAGVAFVILPCYPDPFNREDREQPRVVLDTLRVVDDQYRPLSMLVAASFQPTRVAA